MSAFAASAHAQPSDPDAETAASFQQALEAFNSGKLVAAYSGFLSVYEADAAHTQTTAALLMGGKALYRLGRYVQAIDLLETFRSDYPTSSYLAEAEQLIAYARLRARQGAARADAVVLGVALPFTGSDRTLTQKLFNGIRLAVDSHNRRSSSTIRIVFMDTRNTAAGAAEAAEALSDSGAAAILGPLYSNEVLAAARVAERNELVLVAPLATNSEISRGRRFVFQANVPMMERGRFAAMQAHDRLGLRSFGIITEAGDRASEDLAGGFADALAQRGLTPEFEVKLTSASDWSRLVELAGDDLLYDVDGLFFALSRGSQGMGIRRVQAALNQLALGPYPRPAIIGGSSWHDLNMQVLGERLRIWYLDVIHARSGANRTRTFDQAYEALSRDAPDELAYVGYDVAQSILPLLEGEGPLAPSLRAAELFNGLGTRIFYDHGQHNTELFLFRHTPGGGVLVR